MSTDNPFVLFVMKGLLSRLPSWTTITEVVSSEMPSAAIAMGLKESYGTLLIEVNGSDPARNGLLAFLNTGADMRWIKLDCTIPHIEQLKKSVSSPIEKPE